MTAASLHHYDTEKDIASQAADVEKRAQADVQFGEVIRANHADNVMWASRIRGVIKMVEDEIARNCGAPREPIKPITQLAPWEVAQRRKKAESDAKFRKWLNEKFKNRREPNAPDQT
ncbi:hypothetical protein WS89_22595 [Burkholderia sp. MSMB1072]|nr:hypothetical protein WS89_22595 [Burkholderia sp. MSMB1072]